MKFFERVSIALKSFFMPKSKINNVPAREMNKIIKQNKKISKMRQEYYPELNREFGKRNIIQKLQGDTINVSTVSNKMNAEWIRGNTDLTKITAENYKHILDVQNKQLDPSYLPKKDKTLKENYLKVLNVAIDNSNKTEYKRLYSIVSSMDDKQFAKLYGSNFKDTLATLFFISSGVETTDLALKIDQIELFVKDNYTLMIDNNVQKMITE